MSRRSRFWYGTVLAGILGCSGSIPSASLPAPALPPQEVALSLYLIGDAGGSAPGGDPVLQALTRELEARPSRGIVVFLGDNVYPRGLPPPGQPSRAEAERRLGAQIEAVVDGGGTGYFVPGNHDWAKSGNDGWDAVKRQQGFIDSAGAGATRLLPGRGCPGPSHVDIGRLRLVLLDTQWWLHSGAKPRDPGSDCPTDSEAEVVDSLRGLLAEGRHRLVVVAGHHPLASGGVHGGYFGFRDHVFPLRPVVEWLWVPLPFLGSLYPAARQYGFSSQDIPSRAYQRMIRALRRAFEEAPPALYAAGHEHNLQVIAGGAAPLELVSGSGYYGHSGRVVPIDGTLYARKASGFARLDIPHYGKARLAILEVDQSGRSREAFSTWVE